jgi:hypothetical protein
MRVSEDILKEFGIDMTEISTKVCSKCGIEKSLIEFPKHSHAKDNLDARCRVCIKKHSSIRRKLYKTAPPKPSVCESCGNSSNRMCLDHDYMTHEFRGWLCDMCNTGIGQLGDDIPGIKKALNYLERHEKSKA